MPSTDVEVLVVGAGPTGLAMAADLLRRGIRTRIIDQALSPSDKSKALGVQAGTLEAIDSTLGSHVTERMIRQGMPSKSALIHIDQLPEISVDLSTITSPYNYILILSQSLTEQVLADEVKKLGGIIEWQKQLVSFRQDAEGVFSEIFLSDGQREFVRAQYVVGCDGAHSKVRKILSIPFPGDQYEGEFILGDVQIQWPLSYDGIHVFISSNGVMPCFPLNNRGLYRFIPIPKIKSLSRDENIGLEEFTSVVKSICPVNLKIANSHWLTRFRVHRRLSKRFSLGRVFLAGDAAHIHSPAGGQGMNTGIQDALNLSHKMFQVLRQGKRASLLADYERQRRPVAKNVLFSTDLAFKAALYKEGRVSKFVRAHVLPRLIGSSNLRSRVVQAISEVNIARREISLRSKESGGWSA